MDIFFRLREERERLGLSQQEMAEAGGVKKMAQWTYEKGERHPDTRYLAAIAALGADVLYILTGQHAGGAASVSAGDRVLLDNFHAAPEQVQAGIKTALGAFADAPHQVGKRKRAA